LKVFVCSDVHGNVRALDAVLSVYRDLYPCEFLFLGDCIGYGPHPGACLDRILALPRSGYLMGNHEWALIDARERENMSEPAARMLNWSEEILGGKYDDIIRNRFGMEIETESYLAVHASPLEPEKWSYLISEFWANEAFAGRDFDLCFVGHTHIPALFTYDGGLQELADGEPFQLSPDNRYIVNPGSVGQPRDLDPRASCCLYDMIDGTITLFRCEYDIEKTVKEYDEAGVPEYLGRRLLTGS
jgi:diadenosine tetraphosphatase ApaH/serine/threonine PP2A family protein phosphatase